MTEIMENPEEHRDSILTLIRGILGRCPGVIDVAWPCHPWEATAYARNDHDDWLVRSSGGETELAKFIAIAVQEGGAVRAECTRGQSAEVEVRLFDNTDRLVEHRTIPGDALPMSPGEVVSKISCLLPTRSTAPTNHGPAFGCPPPVRPSERPQFKVFFGNPSETHETTTIQDLKTMLPAVIEKWPKKGREPRSD
jgi:hypothetical protein